MAEAAVKPDVTPGMSRVKTAWNHLWPGVVAGIAMGLGGAILGAGPGTLAGGFASAVMLGGDTGKTVATVTGMEAAQLLFVGSE